MSAPVEIKDSRISFGIEEVIRSMDKDQKLEILSWIASERDIVEHVVSVICGEDPLGWAISDPQRMQEILTRIEDKQIQGVPRYSWKAWDELRQKIKDIRNDERLYWILYHKIEPDLSAMVFKELRKLGVESNYTTNDADDDVKRIEELLAAAFKAMRNEDT